jgi:hypothetical protein
MPIYLTSMPKSLRRLVTPYRSAQALHASNSTPASSIRVISFWISGSLLASNADGPQTINRKSFHQLRRFALRTYMKTMFIATSLSPLVHITTKLSLIDIQYHLLNQIHECVAIEDRNPSSVLVLLQYPLYES